MAFPTEKIIDLLKEAFPEAMIKVEDYVGDGNHFSLELHSPQFVGLSRIAQHRKVYAALGEYAGEAIHAMTIKTIPTKKEG